MLQIKVMEEIKTHVMFSYVFLGKSSHYEILWRKTVELERPQMKIWRMHMACWKLKAIHTHTHSEYVTLTAFPLQQCLYLHKTPLLVRYLQRCTRSFRSSSTWRRLTWATCARPSETTILFARKSEHESPKWREALYHKKEDLIQRRYSSKVLVTML
jgi:hypothetical protein